MDPSAGLGDLGEVGDVVIGQAEAVRVRRSPDACQALMYIVTIAAWQAFNG
jgi:hypothetical protein